MKALFPLCSPGCPITHYADQAGLELRDLPVSVSWVLEWMMYIPRTMKNIKVFTAVKGNSKNSWKFICVFITIEIIVCGTGSYYVAQASINFLPLQPSHFVCWADLPAVPQSDSFSGTTWGIWWSKHHKDRVDTHRGQWEPHFFCRVWTPTER